VGVAFVPESKGVESLARQIKVTGRAYPVFEIAQLVLAKPERYQVTFSEVKNPDGQVAQSLWLCNIDNTLWLSTEEAVGHVLRRHFDLFYQAERTPTDPPKGTYTFVAQCGFSGTILGPPNYHDYQNKLHKLHAARFSRMPLEAYKSRIRIVRDEAVVKQWVDEQSWKTEYVCLNVPEALKVPNRDEAEKHFREVHAPALIQQVDAWTASAVVAQQLPCGALRQVLRRAWEDQRRFPLRVVTVLSQQLANHGLQFFKVNRTVTHVCVARPHYLDLSESPVSEGVRRIVEYIQSRPGCTRRALVEALAPTPPATTPAPASAPEPEPKPAPAATEVPTAPAPDAQPDVQPGPDAGQETTPAEATAEAPVSESPAPTPATPPPAPAPAPAPAAPLATPEQTAVVSDLHWLIHQGHVIEFANGRLENAAKPKPRPPAPAAPAKAESQPTADTATPPAEQGTPASSETAAEPRSQTPDSGSTEAGAGHPPREAAGGPETVAAPEASPAANPEPEASSSPSASEAEVEPPASANEEPPKREEPPVPPAEPGPSSPAV